MSDCSEVPSADSYKILSNFWLEWNIQKNLQVRVFSASDGDFGERNKSTKYKILQELTLLKAI